MNGRGLGGVSTGVPVEIRFDILRSMIRSATVFNVLREQAGLNVLRRVIRRNTVFTVVLRSVSDRFARVCRELPPTEQALSL